MTLHLDVSPHIEERLRNAAHVKGLSPNEYVIEMLTDHLEQIEEHPNSEAKLIAEINQGLLTEDEWQTYFSLLKKRDDGVLSTEEHQQLIAISELLEEANVRRLESLFELAQLRNTTVEILMAEFDIKPVNYAWS